MTTRLTLRRAPHRLRAVAAVAFALVVSMGLTHDAGPSAPDDLGRRTVLAAPWPLSDADTAYYKMVVLPDGFPARQVGKSALPHPIYGVYLIRGFYRDWQANPTPENRAALITVAEASVRRMQEFRGSLAFWYDPGRTVTLTRAGRRVYSALTQAYYMDILEKVGTALQREDLRVAAHRVFLSLLVPTSLGGVKSPGALGPVFEEEPSTVPSAILNGWLSALTSLKAYADRSGSPEARSVLQASLAELALRLPRYDLPQYLGSAYSSLAYVRLRFDVPVGTTVRAADLDLDGRTIGLRLATGGQASDVVQLGACGALQDGVIVATCSGLELEFPVTSAGISGTARLRVQLAAAGTSRLQGAVSHGVYGYTHDEPRTVTGWAGKTALPTTSTSGTYTLAVTADVIRAALTPTTFKRYRGGRVNVYQQIHIQRLRVLARMGEPTFATYADTWSKAMCEWATSPVYRLIPPADLTCPTAAAARTPTGTPSPSVPS